MDMSLFKVGAEAAWGHMTLPALPVLIQVLAVQLVHGICSGCVVLLQPRHSHCSDPCFLVPLHSTASLLCAAAKRRSGCLC